MARSVLGPLTDKDIAVIPDPAFVPKAASVDAARAALHDANVPLDSVPLVGVAVRRWFHESSNILPHKYAAKLTLRRDRGREQMSMFIRVVAEALDMAACPPHYARAWWTTITYSAETFEPCAASCEMNHPGHELPMVCSE